MTAHPEFDRVLSDWLEDSAAPRPVDYLGSVFDEVRRTRQRPGWTFWSRWLPAVPPSVAPSRAVVWVLLALALIAALVAGTMASGVLRRVAPPHGLARPGLIALDSGGHIMVTDPDGSRARAITSGFLDTAAKWSPDGTMLAFWRAIGDRWSIVVAAPDGTVMATVPTGAPVPADGTSVWAGGVPSALDWAPDSGRLAFSMLTDAIPHIWIDELDGSPPHEIGSAGLPAQDPAWSSDGTRIAFHGGMGVAPDGIYVMNADGSDAHRISRTAGTCTAFTAPRWQPGGELVAYHANPVDSTHVFVANADGTGERDLSLAVRGAPSDSWPSWSPDGHRLAFVRGLVGGGGWQIVVVGLDGGEPLVHSDPAVARSTVEWSPDGRFVIGYLNDADAANGNGVLIVDLTGALPATAVTAVNNAEVHWQRLAP